MKFRTFMLLAAVILSGRLLRADINAISGSLTATGMTLSLPVTTRSAANFQLSGTWSGSLIVEAQADGVNWVTLPVWPFNGSAYSTSLTTNNIYSATVAALGSVRVRAVSIVSGTCAVYISLAAGPNPLNSASAAGGGGGSVSQGAAGSSPWPVTNVASSYGAFVAGGAQALSSSTLAVVLVGGPAGQQTMANSAPVALASDQPAIPVSSTTLAKETGGNLAASATSLGTIATNSGTQATASNQTTINSSVQSVVTNTNNLPTAKGDQNISNSMPVFPASITATGTLSIAGQSLTMSVKNLNTVGFRLSGTWTDGGGASDQCFITADPTGVAGWTAVDIFSPKGLKQLNGVNSSNGTSTWRVNVAGAAFVSLSATSLNSGSITVNMIGSASPQWVGGPDIVSFNTGSQSNGLQAIAVHSMTEKIQNGGASPIATYGGNTPQSITIVASNTGLTQTSGVVVLSPVAGHKFVLLGFEIKVSNFAAAAAGTTVIQLLDGSNAIPGATFTADFPASAATTMGPGWTTDFIQWPDFGYISTANDNKLNLKFSAALTAGSVCVTVFTTYQ